MLILTHTMSWWFVLLSCAIPLLGVAISMPIPIPIPMPIHIPMQNGLKQMAAMLIKHGAQLNWQNRLGWTDAINFPSFGCTLSNARQLYIPLLFLPYVIEFVV